MARTKATARKNTGGMAPRKQIASKAALKGVTKSKTGSGTSALLKPALVELAVKKGMKKTDANKMLKADLIKYLASAKSPKVVTPAKVIPPTKSAMRPCGPVQSKKNPTAYTKEELVDLAQVKLKITAGAAARMGKQELCDKLFGLPSKVGVIKVVKPKVARAKKSKVIPSPSAGKAPVTPGKGKCTERSSVPLKPHQKKVVDYLSKHRGVVIGWDVGSGKTLGAVTISQCYLDSRPDGKVIIVTPVSLQENFKKEMRAYGLKGSDPRYEFHTLASFAKAYAKTKCPSYSMLIIDEAHNLRTDVKKAKASANRRVVKAKARAKIQGEAPGQLRSPVVRADVAIRCAKTVDRVVLLTASSVYNNPRDVANLVAMAKGQDPLSETEFERMTDSPAEFRRYFSCIFSFYPVPKDENYPTVREHNTEIVMTSAYYKKYKDVEDKVSPFYNIQNPWRFLVGVRQATNDIGECLKCKWAINKVKEGKRTVIYSAFLTRGIRVLQEDLKKEGIPYVEVTGEMDKEDRDQSVKRYNSGAVNVLLITKAGGEGLDLKGTRTVIILESSWNRETEKQIIGRAARYMSHSHLPKNEKFVDVYFLLLVKPKGVKSKKEKESADILLKNLIEKKEIENEKFRKQLTSVSFENAKC